MSPQCYRNYCNNSVVWEQGNILNQQYNKFCTLSYSPEETNACLLTSSTIEGPFYLPDSIVRKDIREHQPGIDLQLKLKVVDVRGCRPIPNAVIDIWHANAFGIYSGYEDAVLPPLGDVEDITHLEPINDETYLRGRQYTNGCGMAEFYTIYPGWYEFRTVHIHLKVFFDDLELLTTQLFFPQTLNYQIQSLPPYNIRPISHYINENDFVLRISHGVEGGWPKVIQRGNSYTASLTIGVIPGKKSDLPVYSDV